MWGKWPGCLWCLHWEQCLWSMWGSDLAACGCLPWEIVSVVCVEQWPGCLRQLLIWVTRNIHIKPCVLFPAICTKTVCTTLPFFPYKKLRVMNAFSPTFFLGLHTREALSFKCAFNHLVYNIPSNQNRFVICEPCAKTRYLASLRK